jgi:hypothetical protein
MRIIARRVHRPVLGTIPISVKVPACPSRCIKIVNIKMADFTPV